MKTYNIIKGIFAATVLSVVFSGCSEDAMDRINKDHGHTQSVAGRFILTDVITSTAFSNAGGDFNTYLSAYIEYEVGVDNQLYYAETRESEPTSSSTFNNTWNGLYSTLKSARIIINQCSEGGIDYGNFATKGMAEVLAAYNCALIADMFGDAPCSQAALVDENGSPVYLTPKMDKQEEIYTQAMQYLDDAIADLQKEDLIDPGAQDLLYQGDAEKWLKLAYGLKARYTMHLLKRSANKDADMEKVLEYVDNSFESAEEQAAFDVYDANNINPLYGFFVARAGLGASESMRSKLAEYNDPRLSRAFITKQGTSGKEQAPGTADNAVYAPNGTPEQGTSKYGTSLFMYSISAPTLLLSYHELKFLEAEALCRLERDAKSALKDAVVAGLLNAENSFTISRKELGKTLINAASSITEAEAESYFDNTIEAKYTAEPLKATMTQKYFALWGASGEATESYNDVRRMKGLGENFIELKNPNSFPLRCPYGNSDTTTNAEVKAAYGNGQYVYSENVWWAGGSR